MKFHLIACVPRRPGASCFSALNSGWAFVAVDLDLGEHRERHIVLVAAEFLDLALVARLLMAELVAGEAEHGEAAFAKAPVQRFEARILRSEAALARDIDDQQRLAREIAERARLAVDGLEGDVGWEGHAELRTDLRAPIGAGARREAFYPFSLNGSKERCARNDFIQFRSPDSR